MKSTMKSVVMLITVTIVWHVIPEVHLMIKRIINTIFFLLLLGILPGTNLLLKAQEPSKIIEGSVSYITGQNIYVKFVNTAGIENGDTLFRWENEILAPALVVQHHSSISCLCNPVGEKLFKVSDIIFCKSKGQH